MLPKHTTAYCRAAYILALLVGLLALNFSVVPSSYAAPMITFDGSPRDGAPPPTLGPYTMTPFARDEPLNSYVTDVHGPMGVIHFDQQFRQTVVYDQWGEWGHGYLGNVYYDPQTTANRVVITLPPNTGAFYLYVMPVNYYDDSTIVATANGIVTSDPIFASGWAAGYVGFYATGGATLQTITIETGANQSFGLGEFAIAPVLPQHSVHFHQPLDPSNSARIVTNKAKAGRTIPVKVEIFDGQTEQDSTNTATPPTLAISEVACSTGVTDQVESYLDTSNTNGAIPTFRWSTNTPGFWIANLDTKAAGMSVGTCYRLDVYLDNIRVTTDATEWAIVELT